jgi:hypothetical protein
MRDPGQLGNALLHLAKERKEPISEIAEQVDRGILGIRLLHPAFLNGRSNERIEAIISL